MPKKLLCARVVGLLLPFVSSCEKPVERARQNVLLISVDTLRADRLGAYGYPRPTSPRIDEFLGQAVTFEDAQVHAPWTIPSLASWLTSLYPSTHGATRFDTPLRASVETLPEMLRARGYRTMGMLAQVFLQQRYGLVQGIDELELPLREGANGDTRPLGERATSAEVAQLAVSAFERLRGEQGEWLLWLHFFDPHEAYVIHPGISEAFGVASPSDRYDGEVRFTDHYVGTVLDALAHYGHADDTIVVFFSDHGEEFGEHGGKGHGQSLHEELMRVPFAIRAPGVAPRRVPDLVAAIDLVPTLLELLELPPSTAPIEGRSLVPLLRGESMPPEPVFSELMKDRFQDGLTSGRHKLIVERLDDRDTQVSLYDRVADPHESKDIAEENRELVEKMRGALQVLRTRARSNVGAVERFEMSEADRDLMRQLGYLK